MFRKFKSISNKLFSLVMQILIITLGISQLTASVLLIILSHNTFRISQERIEENLIDKGRVLVANNSIALQGMVEDNAFNSINELVSSTLQKDKDVVYGIFMDNLRQPWVNVNTRSPEGKFTTLTAANDSISVWAQSISEVTYKRINDNPDIIEFAAPVNVMGQRMGTIRYGISTSRMEKLIDEQKRAFKEDIFRYIIILLIITILMLLYGLRAARVHAKSITQPIDELASAAEIISAGNYTIPVKSSAKDEIGVLATGFEISGQAFEASSGKGIFSAGIGYAAPVQCQDHSRDKCEYRGAV